MTKWRVSACAAALMMCASGAAAATINVTNQNSSSVWRDADGNNAWYVGTSFAVGEAPDPVETRTNIGAGVFRLTGTDIDTNDAMDFLAFCLQPLEWLTLPRNHEMGHSLLDSVYEDLMALANNAWADVDDSNNAAAFQMAVWEIANEGGAYDVDAGHFRITGDSDASNSAEQTAQVWLNNISSGDWTAGDANFMILSAEGTQDLLTNVPVFDDPDLNEVPLPATGLLLLAGLAGFGAAARRKRTI